MKCPRCGKELEWMGNVTILIKDTDKYFHQLTKKAFSSKDIELWGANWDEGTLFCPNYLKCGNHPAVLKENCEQVKIKKKSSTEMKDSNESLTNDEILKLLDNLGEFVSNHPVLFPEWLKTNHALEVAKKSLQE